MSGQKAGSETAVYTARRIFKIELAEAVLLIDALKAFYNCHQSPIPSTQRQSDISSLLYLRLETRLIVIGGVELSSKDKTTQGDPICMAVYATGITLLLEDLYCRSL